jgi:hypothetical protein
MPHTAPDRAIAPTSMAAAARANIGRIVETVGGGAAGGASGSVDMDGV